VRNPIQKSRLSSSQVQILPEFQNLPKKQKVFCPMVADGVEMRQACLGAFGFRDALSAQKALSKLTRRPKLRAVLARMFPSEVREDAKRELLREVDELAADRHTTHAQVEALVAKGILLGLIPPRFTFEKSLQGAG